MNSTKTFSLLTLLLLTAIVALSVSHYAMMQKLAAAGDRIAAAEAEVNQFRKKYGHIRVDDTSLTYVAKIGKYEREQEVLAYRVIIPNGNHYLLHITETDSPDADLPPDIEPSKTMSMGNWKRGADTVLSFEMPIENGETHLVISTETKQLVDYKVSALSASGEHDAWELQIGQTDPQSSFTPCEPIHFMWHRDPNTKRGILVWMETVTATKKETPQSQTEATPPTAPYSSKL